MFKFLLIVQTLIAASLVSVILMQRSEGGGLGVGGSSSGFMTARGAADFLTRSTAILGGLFIALSILLSAGCAAWGFVVGLHPAFGFSFGVVALALIIYGVIFLRKSKGIIT